MEHEPSEKTYYASSRYRHHPYQRPSLDFPRDSREVKGAASATQTWRPKNREVTFHQQLDTPNSRISDRNRDSVETKSDSQRTITEVPQNREESRNRANGLLITHSSESESERRRKLKGKAPAVVLSKADKIQNFLMQNIQPGGFAIREPNPSSPHSSPKIPDDTPAIRQSPEAQSPVDKLIEDSLMEEPVEGNLTAADIDNMINELADSVTEPAAIEMDTEMLDNDDLLGEELESEAEQIEAISQLSPIVLHDFDNEPENQEVIADSKQQKKVAPRG